jgi:hypothetical protein
MSNRARNSELALVTGFLAVIAAVPATQTCLELARHERVQFTDLFRYRPTAKNFRQFEHGLEEKSWFRQKLRPEVQRLFFSLLRDPGAKGLLGRDRWLFYRPDVRYLVEPDWPQENAADSKWVDPSANHTRRENVIRAIVRFRDQLKERGIALVVMPVPGKPSVYPDQVTRREIGQQQQFRSPTLELLDALRSQGVASVDLFAAFRDTRSEAGNGGASGTLYLAQDTHWTPRGAQVAAHIVATQLRKMHFAPAAAKEFRTRPVGVTRWGDILDMMQIPGLREACPPQPVACEQVLDPALGPLVPSASDRPGTYRYPGQKASALVLGDSFCRIYQYPEPRSLGEMPANALAGPKDDSGTKRLLPGSAGFISHLALALKSPVDAIVSDGGASTDVRRKLSTNPEILEGKQVVVWEFVERDIALGGPGWEDVPLPEKLN